MSGRITSVPFTSGWRDLARGIGLGIGLSVPTFVFTLGDPSGISLWLAVLGLAGVLAVWFVRFDAGLVGAWIAGVSPLYLLLRELAACDPIPGPAVAVCVGPPAPGVTLFHAGAVALVLGSGGYLVAGLFSRMQRRIGDRRPDELSN